MQWPSRKHDGAFGIRAKGRPPDRVLKALIPHAKSSQVSSSLPLAVRRQSLLMHETFRTSSPRLCLLDCAARFHASTVVLGCAAAVAVRGACAAEEARPYSRARSAVLRPAVLEHRHDVFARFSQIDESAGILGVAYYRSARATRSSAIPRLLKTSAAGSRMTR